MIRASRSSRLVFLQHGLAIDIDLAAVLRLNCLLRYFNIELELRSVIHSLTTQTVGGAVL